MGTDAFNGTPGCARTLEQWANPAQRETGKPLPGAEKEPLIYIEKSRFIRRQEPFRFRKDKKYEL